MILSTYERRHPLSTLFPYTTLFRSKNVDSVQSIRSAERPSHAAENWRRIADGSRGESAEVVRWPRSEEHTSELQSRVDLGCRLLPEKKNRMLSTNESRHPLEPPQAS